MTQDYSECKYFHDKNLRLCSCFDNCTRNYPQKLTPKCDENTNCYYKQNKRNEHQLKLVNQDNDALSRYCEMLEEKITQLTNMQNKKDIIE